MQRYAIIFSWLLAMGVGMATPKTALLRVGEVYRSLPAVQEMEGRIASDQQEIMRSPRAVAYQTARRELDELEAGLGKLPPQDEAGRERALRELTLKREEVESLKRDFDAYRRDRMNAINLFRVDGMEKILAEIRRKAAEIGSARGYAWVLDADGSTNTKVPVVLYAKGADDITADVIEALGVSETEPDQDDTR